MKRNNFGMSHKFKTSIDVGLITPCLTQEMIPGDIIRINPEVLIKSVVPPVTQLTDKIKYNVELSFTPNRLVDDKFVANLSTTKTGTVKGNFKTWSKKQIEERYGHNLHSSTGTIYQTTYHIPNGFHERKRDGVAEYTYTYHGPEILSIEAPYVGQYDPNNEFEYNDALPCAYNIDDGNGNKKPYRCAPFFTQGSLFDYLGIDPCCNLGWSTSTTGDDRSISTYPISAYYMFCNFYHTVPEYEKYIAPHFDYPKVTDTNAQSEGRTRLHRYETLEEEFGNGFEYPSLSGRCVNGLVVDNWDNGYFSKTMKDPQRGIAPTVPVSLTGVSYLYTDAASLNANVISDASKRVAIDGTPTHPVSVNLTTGNASASFVISDLRSALALQHFQEDTQECFKWTDFLQKVYGTAPLDTLADQPIYVGGYQGVLVSDEVLCTAQTSDGDLGDIGGKLTGYNKGKMFTFKAKEHGTFLVTITIKPERNFMCGVDRSWTRKNYLDMYFPQFVGIGNQAIRRDEVVACFDKNGASANWGFTSRYEEFKHRRNRIGGKCRNTNMVVPLREGTNAPLSDYMVSVGWCNQNGINTPYYNDFHPYAISDGYVNTYGFMGKSADNFQHYDSNNQRFLLCLPQMNDIFVSDKEEPFLMVMGFNMDMFRPIPIATKPGVSYV